MKYKAIAFIATIAAIFAACNNKTTNTSINITPDAGTRYKLGDAIAIKVSLPADLKADSIQYLIDSTRIISRKDTLTAKLKTDSMKLGSKLITARVFSGGKATEASTNIILLAAKAPEVYTYKVEKVYPHDTSSYTEGLQYVDGYLYESTGVEGHSRLLKTDVATGKVLQAIKLDSMYFGEGIAVVGDRILQLTWKEKVAFIYDKATFKKLKTIPYNWGLEGWGVTFDGTTIYNNDSTNRIFMLNKDTYAVKGFIDVCDDKAR